MEPDSMLGLRFLECVDEPARTQLASEAELEQTLSALVAAAQSAWPEVTVPTDRFLPWLAHRLPPGEDPMQGLRALNAIDLYVTCACAQGDARAIVALEQRYFRDLDAALRRLRVSPSLMDEAKQALRQELFVPAPGSAPAIANYSGRGQLRRWLRIIAVRAARRLARAGDMTIPMDDHLTAVLPSPEEDPELLHLKRRYGEAFRAAFSDALRALPEQERLLLRQHFVDRLTLDELGARHGVHRATVARRLAGARESVASMTREAMIARHAVAPAEYDSLARLIRSQLDLSLRGQLAGGAEPEG
jgi:RNA polymerase sigma-70 factor (ECF subfamily)